MILTDITAYASIRTALGVTATELPDAELADVVYVTNLQIELTAIHADLLSNRKAAKGDSANTARNFIEALATFSAYFVADLCADTFGNRIPKSLTDSKAGYIRQAERVVAEDRQRLRDRKLALRRHLEVAHAAFAGITVSEYTVPTMLGISSPSVDPVVGS